jgi:hypothetical protein
MPVLGVGRLDARGDLVAEHLQRPAAAQREDLVAADALDPVQAPVRLRDRVAGDEDAVVLHEDDRPGAHQRGQALALRQRRGEAGVVVVVGDLAVEERRRLARRQQPVVGQHVERGRPRLVRVQDDARTGDAVDRRMDALRRQLERSFALEDAAGLVEHDQVAGARFRPVQPERQDEVLPVAARHGHREVVVDAFLELVQDGEAMRRGEVDARFGDGIRDARRDQGADGHRGLLGTERRAYARTRRRAPRQRAFGKGAGAGRCARTRSCSACAATERLRSRRRTR